MTMHKEEHVYEWGKSLIEFTSRLGISGQVSGVRVRGYNPMEKKGFNSLVMLDDLTLKIGGKTNWTDAHKSADPPRVVHIFNPDIKDATEAKEAAHAILHENSFKLFRASGSGEGNEELKAGATVDIKYVGKLYSGEYIVYSVLHKFSFEEGYITEFYLKRNMLPDEVKKKPLPMDMYAGKYAAAESQVEDDEAEDEEEEEPRPEIVSVKCLDKEGKETAECYEGERLKLEATCNADVDEGATVIFKCYWEGDDPEQDEPIVELRGVNRDGTAIAEWDCKCEARNRLAEERWLLIKASSEGCEDAQSGNVEIKPGRGVIHIIPRFNQQGSDANNAVGGDWREEYISRDGGRNGLPMRDFGCAVALVANIAHTQGSQSITPETIRAVNANFNGNGAIIWVRPLREWNITLHRRVDAPLTVDAFNEFMDHPTPRYYIAIRIFITGNPGDEKGEHWVGASEIVPLDNPKYVRISPTSENDWEEGTPVGRSINNRNVRGWRVEDGNIYVPLDEVVGYRVFKLPENQ